MLKHLFIVDDFSVGYDITRDTSHLLINEVRKRGHTAAITYPHQLGLENGEVVADGKKVADYDVVWLRKDPPVDRNYFEHLQLLTLVKGPFFVNDPRAVLELNEKLSIFNFRELIPKTLVLTANTSDLSELYELFSPTGFVVLKPLNSFAGGGVKKVSIDEFGRIREVIAGVAESDENYCIAQEFLPNVSQGDTRIHIVDGEPIGALLRVPPADGFKGNIHAGGAAHIAELTPKHFAIAKEVGAWLKSKGIFFAGIDTIDGYLTEINVTSPGVIIETNEVSGVALEQIIIDMLCEHIVSDNL